MLSNFKFQVSQSNRHLYTASWGVSPLPLLLWNPEKLKRPFHTSSTGFLEVACGSFRLIYLYTYIQLADPLGCREAIRCIACGRRSHSGCLWAAVRAGTPSCLVFILETGCLTPPLPWMVKGTVFLRTLDTIWHKKFSQNVKVHL